MVGEEYNCSTNVISQRARPPMVGEEYKPEHEEEGCGYGPVLTRAQGESDVLARVRLTS